MSIGLIDDLRDGIDVHLAPLTVRQYRQMIRNGILQDGDAIDLIQVALLHKDRRDQAGGIRTHGPRHLRALNKLMAILSQWVVSKGVFLQVQGPIVVGETSEPEPDWCLIRGTPDDFTDEVPQPTDVVAVFEVAYSSLQSDRQTKQRLYENAGIPVYLVINLRDNLVEILSNPSKDDAGYLTISQHHPLETIAFELEQHGLLSFSGQSLLYRTSQIPSFLRKSSQSA